jgi:SAM-dependent methyltransferase
MWLGEFLDPRLAAVYDALCPRSQDDEFFVDVVQHGSGHRVLDLGCGTGRLALALAHAGYSVTGVDPARPMLDVARRKKGADTVTWIEGTAGNVETDAFDIALMTAHVSQFLVDDDAWAATLADLARALVPGGRLAFDTRDPAAEGWRKWNSVESRKEVLLPDGRGLLAWIEVTDVEDGLVSIVHRYEFDDGEELDADAALRFRDEDEVRTALAAAGFAVEAFYGGWRRQPVGKGDGELLVLASATG